MIVRDNKGRFAKGSHSPTEFKKGNICLWKGKTKENCEVLRKISDKLVGRRCGGGTKGKHWKVSEEGRNNIRLGHIGLKHSEVTKKKMGLAKLGSKNPMSKIENRLKVSLSKIGKPHPQPPFTKEHCRKLSEAGIKRWQSPEYRKKQELKWQNSEYRRRVLGRRPITFYESRLLSLVSKYSLPYKFVGNGEAWFGSYNPDFININGAKKIVEVFSKHQKIRNYGSIQNYKQIRSEHFAKYGYKVVFFNEDDLFRDDWEEHCLRELTND